MAGDCSPTCPVDNGFYDYDLNIAGNSILLAAYILLIPLALYLGFRFSSITFSVILLAGLALEVVGFAGRILLNDTPRNEGFFAIFFLGTVLGPTFITAAAVLTLPYTQSQRASRSKSRHQILATLVLLVLLAIAAAIETIGAVAVAFDFGALDRARGAHLVAGGSGVQTLAVLGFAGLHFKSMATTTKWSTPQKKYSRVNRADRPSRSLADLALGAASLLLAGYSIYRIIEVAIGLQGALFQNEPAFMAINGALPLIAALLLTISQPPTTGKKCSILPRTRHVPPPLKSPKEQMEAKAHHRYDPDIRKQFSPGSERSAARQSNPPEVAQGSPGLPSSPRPLYKSTTKEKETAHGHERNNSRSSAKEMVRKDSLW